MSKLNLKIKSNLKKQIEQEKSGGKDTRFLNYFDLKDGEKMTILFLPDVNGELWTKFSKHGPNMKTAGVGSINCAYKSNGMECPSCQKGFELLNASKEAGGDKELKEEAKKWFSKDYTLVQCIVLESPMEISESPDGNQVKLMYLPFAIENILKESVTEGIVPEDEICTTPFVIKKTKNQGGYASYENSYFARKQVTDEELEVFEEFKIEQFDFSSLDIIPDATTTQEVQEWVEKAEQVLSGGSEDKGGQQDHHDKKSSTSSLQERMKASREIKNEDTDKMDKEYNFDSNQDKVEEPESNQSDDQSESRGSSLRDRLRNRSK